MVMEQFINFIVDLANEELYEKFKVNAEAYFLHGGCFEFAKILKQYIGDSKIVINKENNHCGVLYSGEIYDATGKIKEKENFVIANKNDIEYMKDKFGIPEMQYIQGKRVSDYLIQEIKKCNIEFFIQNMEEEKGDER